MRYLSLFVVLFIVSTINAQTINWYSYIGALNCPAANVQAPVNLTSGACVGTPGAASERITIMSYTSAQSCTWNSNYQCSGQGNCVSITNGECMNGSNEVFSVKYSWGDMSAAHDTNKMVGKTLLSILLFLLLLIPLYLFIGAVDLKSHFFPLTQSPPCATAPKSHPLRVFMYDLPSRFNLAMIDRRITDDAPPPAKERFPPWPSNSGLKQQHSVEYWMMASLIDDGSGEYWREAVRVLDPEAAEVFFVPFFSSTSFNTHGHNMTDPETEKDRQLQVDLLDFLRKSQYWQRSEGRDHVIPMHHPNAFRFLRDQVNASILIVADFGRYPKTMSRLSKDVVAPYVHVVESFVGDNSPDPFVSRTTLLFFRGRTVRKDEGIVRAKLAKILESDKDVHYERSFASDATIKASSEGMRTSKFCLHPAGDTPSSCRLFDAIVSHCVPVIVSDKIELPYEDELDYTQFCLFFSVKEALKPGYMVEQLRKIDRERWIEMWKKLKDISHHYEFQYPPNREDAVNMLWRQVGHKLPASRLAVHRNRRLKIPDWWELRRR